MSESGMSNPMEETGEALEYNEEYIMVIFIAIILIKRKT